MSAQLVHSGDVRLKVNQPTMLLSLIKRSPSQNELILCLKITLIRFKVKQLNFISLVNFNLSQIKLILSVKLHEKAIIKPVIKVFHFES